MNNLKTYEGFFDVFKKSQKVDDIRKELLKDLEEKFYPNSDKYHIVTIHSSDIRFILEYRITIHSHGQRNNWVGLQDVFNISLEKKKNIFVCTIKISREHNYRYHSKLFDRESIASEEVSININSIEKLPQIINQIQSESSKLYNKIKSNSEIKKKSEEIIDNIKNYETRRAQEQKDALERHLKFIQERDKYKNNLLKEFDIDNVESLVLDLKDESNDVRTEVIEIENRIYFRIYLSYIIDSDDEYGFGIKSRIICNDFIKRYKSEYGDEYNIKTYFGSEGILIDFKLGEYPNELKDFSSWGGAPKAQ